MARGTGFWGLLLVVLVVAGAAVGMTGSAYTSSSSFCTSCHEMSTRYISWTRSTHNQVECMDCHAGVGFKGYVQAKIGGARQAMQHFFGHIGDIHAKVADPVCMKCHFFSKDSQFVYEPIFGDKPLYVPDDLHRVHFKDQDSTCQICHTGLVHGSLEGGVPIKRKICDDCHREKKILVEIQYDGTHWVFPAGIKL